jgi:hypothetical protein
MPLNPDDAAHASARETGRYPSLISPLLVYGKLEGGEGAAWVIDDLPDIDRAEFAETADGGEHAAAPIWIGFKRGNGLR